MISSDECLLQAVGAEGVGTPDASLPDTGHALSVVVPVFNEAQVLPEFHRRLLDVLHGQAIRFEVIYVDDGSRDGSVAVLREFQRSEPAVGVMRLSRNFGKEAALSAGLRAACGACVIVIDADLQDPPELIPEMLRAWQQGHDVVNMHRRSREGETWFKTTSAGLFYGLLNRLSQVPIPEDVGDFRLLSRRAVDALNSMPERNRYMKGLFAWVGFGQLTLDYDRDPRAAGVAKQNYWRLWGLAIDGITSFSIAPLRVASLGGLLAAGLAFALTVFYGVKALLFGDSAQGFPTLIVAILSLGGMNLLAMGVIGEYLGRLFVESKQRPLFVVDEFALPQSRRVALRPPLAALQPSPEGAREAA
ncbi:MAG: glycosyltransferase family 2 protein [Rubrivivax sp.]|nr:glycosyltransferase family 2 protein [Rubrivivax sp.]